MQFKDYDANKIADKLKQVLEFEANIAGMSGNGDKT